MARSDLLCELIKAGLQKDDNTFRKAVEAICAEERQKQHTILADKLSKLLKNYPLSSQQTDSDQFALNSAVESSSIQLFKDKVPQKTIDELFLPNNVKNTCNELIQEQSRASLLRSYGLEPRNKLLLIGPPGNGKTSLAEAIAESLMVQLITVRYENIIGSYLGETATYLSKLFDYVKNRQCVLFFDEFDTIAKERGDKHETGEIKRVVSSLLLHIDELPSYVVAIAATNHDQLLDQAVWRRFQINLELPRPNEAQIETYLKTFQNRVNFDFGIEPKKLANILKNKSYAEIKEFALSVYRQYILSELNSNAKAITERQIQLSQLSFQD